MPADIIRSMIFNNSLFFILFFSIVLYQYNFVKERGESVRPFPSGVHLVQNFLNLCRLAYAVAQIKQLGAPYLAASYDLDPVYTGRMQGPGFFRSDAVGNAAHGKRFTDAAVLALDNDALKHLYTFLCALDDLGVNAHGVAYGKRGDIFLKLFLFQLRNNAQEDFLLSFLDVHGRNTALGIIVKNKHKTSGTPVIINITIYIRDSISHILSDSNRFISYFV